MNTQTFQFKTNINCSGCIASVKPHLDQAEGVSQWEVDIKDKDKILTVQTESESPEKVIEAVQNAGFKIEPIRQS